ncbi:hypothetical protein JCM11491_004258 [Sporobolomyces phaffii]
MTLNGLEQLKALQADLNNLIDSYAATTPELAALSDVGQDVDLKPRDPHLADISKTLQHMSAVVLGDKLPFTRAFEFHVISATHVAIEAHVEESLREAWDRGVNSLSAEELAKPTGIDPVKLARCLRLLAAYHIFTETEPNSFSRNRCSASLDSGHSIEEIAKDPLVKYSSDKGGLAAMIGHFAEEGMRAASYMSQSLLSSTGPRDYGFSRAFDGDKIWEYFAREANASKRKRFQCAFGALNQYIDRDESILLGFPWSTLPEGSTVCDVAGRTGNISLDIAKAVPHVKFVVQDQQNVIDNMAIPFWEAPEAKAYKERVELVAHDFFEPQPTKGAAVYLVRMALHGFNDDEVSRILSNLATAADSASKLVIVEAAYESLSAPGAYPPASTSPYLLDLQMLTVINVRERLEQQYEAIALKAGWKLVKTWKTGRDGQRDGVFRHYEFVLA